MAKIDEIREKERRTREMMEREGLDALALATVGNFAWFTCGGANYVGIASEVGVATAVVTNHSKYIVCDNIEARRIADEEVAGQNFEVRNCFWWEGRKDDLVREIAGGGVLGSDVPMTGARNAAAAVDACRFSLTPEEIERYEWLGRNTGECLEVTAREIEPGMTEHEIAAVLDGQLRSRGIVPVVTLIAADERIERYRHPIPTDKKLDRCAMLVTGARKWGLALSATRMVHFGPIPAELRRKHNAVARVDATFIAGTKPGARMGNIFDQAVAAYRDTGFAEEWRLHHQGGPTGYKSREFRVSSSTDALVAANQAFAWNPSITGTKTEDTIIAKPSGSHIISQSEGWPLIETEIGVTSVKRPDILVR